MPLPHATMSSPSGTASADLGLMVRWLPREVTVAIGHSASSPVPKRYTGQSGLTSVNQDA
jgi:hypothetical protein